jgi:hypothetical protein
VLRASYEQIGAKLLSQLKLGTVKRIVLIGPAITTFLQEQKEMNDPALTPSEDLSVPEFIIISPKTPN